MSIHGPRALALVACDACTKRDVPPHAEHYGTGCDLWRTFLPFAELQRQGYGKLPGVAMSGAEWEFKDSSVLSRNVDTLAAWFDVVVLPRLSWSDRVSGERFINALHNAGICVVFEADDDLFTRQINARIHQTTETEAPDDMLEKRRLDRIAALQLCDGVTVTNHYLASAVRNFTDAPVCVVPNAIDVRWWRRVMRHAPRNIPGLTIGWAGGARPEDDLEPMAWAWGQIAQRYPALTFVVAGHQPDVIGRYVPSHRVRRLPWLPVEAYPLNLRQIDIACCAVSDSLFNYAKTPIKVWESTLAGAVVTATPTLYGQAIDDGADGLLAETADEWLQALSTLVDDAQTRKRLRLEQRRRIAHAHTLERNAWRWVSAWTTIVDSFRQTRRRVPRLIAV